MSTIKYGVFEITCFNLILVHFEWTGFVLLILKNQLLWLRQLENHYGCKEPVLLNA